MTQKDTLNSFLVSPQDVRDGHLTIRDEEAHHCARVLRMREGEEIMGIDGEGMAYHARIVSIVKDTVECNVVETYPEWHEPSRKLTLGLSLLKHSAKFDIVVEKAVELGVSAIVPFIAAHTERERGRVDRWREIAVSATKQSLRSRIPVIIDPRGLQEFFSERDQHPLLIAHERATADQSLGLWLANHESETALTILIGPEGGFTEDECAMAERSGGQRVSLGPRRLRSETAAMLCVGMAIQGM